MALTACPECGGKVSGRAEACPHCGFRLRMNAGEVALKEFASAFSHEPRRGCRGCGCLLAILVGLLVISLFAPKRAPDTGTPSIPADQGTPAAPTPVVPTEPEEPASAAAEDPRSPTGSRVKLERAGGAGNTLLADEQTDVEVFRNRAPGDFDRFRDLSAADKVFGVTNGTHALVIATGPWVRRVRILEGPQEGREAWVQAEFVFLSGARPANPEPRRTPAVQEPPDRASKVRAAAEQRERLEAKAETFIKAGRNLESAGKTDAAAGWYRRVVSECPGTPQAAAAAARLKALNLAD